MSTSTCNPSRVQISSQDRDLGQDPANFTITLPSTIENAESFEIVNFAFPNVFYNFGESTSVFQISVDTGSGIWFYAVNLGTEPLNPATLPALNAGQGATDNQQFVIFANGLSPPAGLLNSGVNHLSSGNFFNASGILPTTSRVPITRLYFQSVSELAAYLTAIFQSVVAGDVTSVSGNDANAFTAWASSGWQAAAVNGTGTTSLGSQQALQIYNSNYASPNGVQIPANVTATGDILPRYMPRKCGFTDLVDTLPLTQVDFEYGDAPVNLLATQDVYVTSSLTAAEALSSSGRRDILFKVPLQAPIGGIQSYQATLSGTAQSKIPNNIRLVEIVLLDDNFQPMYLPENAVTSAEIHFIFTSRPAAQNAVSLR